MLCTSWNIGSVGTALFSLSHQHNNTKSQVIVNLLALRTGRGNRCRGRAMPGSLSAGKKEIFFNKCFSTMAGWNMEVRKRHKQNVCAITKDSQRSGIFFAKPLISCWVVWGWRGRLVQGWVGIHPPLPSSLRQSPPKSIKARQPPQAYPSQASAPTKSSEDALRSSGMFVFQNQYMPHILIQLVMN